MNKIETPRLKRITKAQARKLWGKKDMSFCPCNLMPDGVWHPNMDIDAKKIASALASTYEHERNAVAFNQYVANFEWYNCTLNAGYYTAFYLIK